MIRDDETQRENLNDAGGREKPKRRSAKRPLALRVVFGVLAGLLVIALFCAGVFAGDRWLRDDEAEIQGTWYVAGTVVPVTFQGGHLKLSEDVSYEYSLDSAAKTMRYRLANLEGQGRYWFSPDRNYLVIEDGAFSAADTLLADISRLPETALAALSGSDVPLPEGEGCVAFSRKPGSRARAELQVEADALADGALADDARPAGGSGDADSNEGADGAGGESQPIEPRKLSDEVFAAVGEDAYQAPKADEDVD